MARKFFSSGHLFRKHAWIADTHRDNGKRFVVRADEKLTAFLELERLRMGRDSLSIIGRFKSVMAVPTVLQCFAPGVSSVQSGHMVSLGKLRATFPAFASWTISNASSNEYRPASARRFVYP
jgi:hypothetical protein